MSASPRAGQTVLVAIDAAGLGEEVVAGAVAGLGTGCSRITIAGVVGVDSLLGAFAYSTGFEVEDLREELLLEAGAAVCRLVRSLPQDAALDPCVIDGWGRVMEVAREKSYDAVAIAAPPSTLRDRWAFWLATKRRVTASGPAVKKETEMNHAIARLERGRGR